MNTPRIFTWYRAAAELKGGDRVRFVTEHNGIPAGTLATVVENGLPEMQPALIVKLDGGRTSRENNFCLNAPADDAEDEDGKPIADSDWQKSCVVEPVAH